jgi:GNAT superfamily N-acetyltransferase
MRGPPDGSTTGGEFSGLARANLSPLFGHFLPYFALEALRCGGDARIVRDRGRITALWLTDPTEQVASIFAGADAPAAELFGNRGRFATFCERRFELNGECYAVYERSLVGSLLKHSFRHALRPVEVRDLPAVIDLTREVTGAVNRRWFEGLATVPEAGFLAEVGGRLAGVAWVSLVGAHARLHSLTVRAPYRRLGVGSDLVAARLLYALRSGMVDVLSEISERSAASSNLALRAGMRRVGEIYLYPPAAAPA